MRTALPPAQAPDAKDAPDASAPPRAPLPTPGRAAIAPIATDRYFLRVTIGVSTHDKLERARDLLRHSIPSGDVAAILDRALTTLVEQLERRKAGRTIRPKLDARSSDGGHAEAPRARPRNRHIPTSVRRFVWTRDEGRCAFVGPHGRCGETGFLEYHHVVPFATGGASDDKNLELRCRAHNDYEATVFFSREVPDTDGVGAGAGSSMAVFDSA